MRDAATTSNSNNLLQAICTVMGSLDRVSKHNKNTFDNYSFASIDDFLSATAKACSESGIVILQDELTFEVITKTSNRGDKPWLLIKFEFEVHHTTGETMGPMVRTVAVPFTGAQSFGSAQSYALKQFMRSLFQIATGDGDDPDFDPKEKEPPALNEKPKPISKATRAKLLATQEDMSAFETLDIFQGWVARLMAGLELESLTDTQGKNMLMFLVENPDAGTWPEKHKVALAQEIQEHVEAAAEHAAKE